MKIVKNIRKLIFGHDIFISYSRKDSLDYAYEIARYFMKPEHGYDCYIDQLSSTTPGKKLPNNIISAISKSTALVVIGSKGALSSDAISKEVKTFKEQNKNNPIIPIDIDGYIFKADWYPEIEGLAIVDEKEESFYNKQVSPEVLERIKNSLTFTKKSKRLRRTALAFLSFFIISIIATVIMFRQVGKAKAELKETSRKVRQEQLQGYIYLSKIGMGTNSITALKTAAKAYTDYQDIDSGKTAEMNLLDLYNNNEIRIRNNFSTGGMLSPAGSYINDGNLAEVSTKKLLFTKETHDVTFSPDDEMVAVIDSDKLNIYKTKGAVLVNTLILKDTTVAVYFDDRNKFIFLTYYPPGEQNFEKHKIFVIDRSTQRILASITVPYSYQPMDYISADGGVVLITDDKDGWLYYVATGNTIRIQRQPAKYLDVDYRFMDDGSVLEYSATSSETTGYLKGTEYQFRFRQMNLNGDVLQDSVFYHTDIFHNDPNGLKAHVFHNSFRGKYLFGISGNWGASFLINTNDKPFKSPKRLVFGSILNSYDAVRIIDTSYFLGVGFRNDEYTISIFRLEGETPRNIFSVVNKNHPNGNIEDDAFMKSISIAYNPSTKFLTIYDRGTGECTKYFIDKPGVKSAKEFVELVSGKRLLANEW